MRREHSNGLSAETTDRIGTVIDVSVKVLETIKEVLETQRGK